MTTIDDAHEGKLRSRYQGRFSASVGTNGMPTKNSDGAKRRSERSAMERTATRTVKQRARRKDPIRTKVMTMRVTEGFHAILSAEAKTKGTTMTAIIEAAVYSHLGINRGDP